MSFPCLICGDLPLISQQGLSTGNGGGGPTTSSTSSTKASGGGGGAAKKSGGTTTIRTLSKDVSDKIFQNLCRHLHIATEPYWFIQNPGEQMPLCAVCSASVLEIYTLQSKIDQFQAMIKKHVWKLERIVADTEIASNWLATREEQETEEAMWNNLPCAPMAIRIARERHHKFRAHILQNFKNKVKLRQKMRAAGQQDEFDIEMDLPLATGTSFEENNFNSRTDTTTPSKRARMEESQSHQQNNLVRGPQATSSSSSNPRPAPAGIPLPFSNFASNKNGNVQLLQNHTGQPSPSRILTEPQLSVKIPSTISISAARVNQSHQEFIDESEFSDSDNNSQMYPDVQIVCSAGSVDFLKEENDQDYVTNTSGDGEESVMEQDTSLWNVLEGDNMEGQYDPMSIPDSEEALWLAPDVALRKSFVDKLLQENLKPSVFLRKLTFAMFGLKSLANSSGICGSNKSGSKPVDRYKFEALREYTIDTYGIRENFNELDDLNRKIRTICCDARKALKRRVKTVQAVSLLPSAGLTPTMSLKRADIGGFSSVPLAEVTDSFDGINDEGDTTANDNVQNEEDQPSTSLDDGGS